MSNARARHEHPMTKRCRLAVQRAEKALQKARAKLENAQREFSEAETDLINAKYDLGLNEVIDEQTQRTRARA